MPQWKQIVRQALTGSNKSAAQVWAALNLFRIFIFMRYESLQVQGFPGSAADRSLSVSLSLRANFYNPLSLASQAWLVTMQSASATQARSFVHYENALGSSHRVAAPIFVNSACDFPGRSVITIVHMFHLWQLCPNVFLKKSEDNWTSILYL